jgi:hypothetical protein
MHLRITELERMWKEAAVDYFKVLYQHLREGKHYKPKSEYPVTWPRFEAGVSRFRSCWVYYEASLFTMYKSISFGVKRPEREAAHIVMSSRMDESLHPSPFK